MSAETPEGPQSTSGGEAPGGAENAPEDAPEASDAGADSAAPAPPVIEEHPTQVLPEPPRTTYAPPPVWPPPGAPAPTSYPAAPSAYPPAPEGYPAPSAYPGYPVSYAPVYPSSPRTSTNAIVGLVLAILSWAICPIVPAIIALFLAHSSSREIEESGGTVGGDGLNTATRIIAWINIAAWGAAILIFAAFTLMFVILGLATSP